MCMFSHNRPISFSHSRRRDKRQCCCGVVAAAIGSIGVVKSDVLFPENAHNQHQ